MREIKFRGKSVENGEWIYGDLIKGEHYYISTKDDFHYAVVSIDGHMSTFVNIVIPESVGQYICSYNNNKTGIYEGDIFGITNKNSDIYYKGCRIVKYIKDGFYLVDKENYGDRLLTEISVNTNNVGIAEFMKEQNLDYDIIGNNYDNPELMN